MPKASKRPGFAIGQRLGFTMNIAFPSGFAVSFADSRQRNLVRMPLYKDQLYVPHSTMRGRWRHTATRMIMNALEERQQPKITFDQFNWMALGGVKQGKQVDQEHPSADIIRHRPVLMQHPWASFWGCSEPIFTESRLQIENAEPTSPIKVQTIHGQRTDPVQRGEIMTHQVADPECFDEYLDRIARYVPKSERRKAKREGRVPEENGSDEADSAMVPTNMIFSREVAPSNSEFRTYIEINNPTEIQIGMFVAVLREFSNFPVFGAQAGMNMGIADLTLTTRQHETIRVGGRERVFDAPEPFLDLEQRFWEAFPDLDFSIPILKA